MRLSEAIRLGSLAIQNPQAGCVAACAIGMGLTAVGLSRGSYSDLSETWPWTDLKMRVGQVPDAVPESKRAFCSFYFEGIYVSFDHGVMEGKMTLDALCDQVRAWEDELAAEGINVEQVTMAATPEATHEPAAEHTESLATRR